MHYFEKKSELVLRLSSLACIGNLRRKLRLTHLVLTCCLHQLVELSPWHCLKDNWNSSPLLHDLALPLLCCRDLERIQRPQSRSLFSVNWIKPAANKKVLWWNNNSIGRFYPVAVLHAETKSWGVKLKISMNTEVEGFLPIHTSLGPGLTYLFVCLILHVGHVTLQIKAVFFFF